MQKCHLDAQLSLYDCDFLCISTIGYDKSVSFVDCQSYSVFFVVIIWQKFPNFIEYWQNYHISVVISRKLHISSVINCSIFLSLAAKKFQNSVLFNNIFKQLSIGKWCIFINDLWKYVNLSVKWLHISMLICRKLCIFVISHEIFPCFSNHLWNHCVFL